MPQCYRAFALGRPLGPWRPDKSLAQQDAVDEGEGSRDPDTGWPYLSVGVTIEQVEGDLEMSADEERWIFALSIWLEKGASVEAFIEEKMRSLREDPDKRVRWRQILDRVRQARKAAVRATAQAAE